MRTTGRFNQSWVRRSPGVNFTIASAGRHTIECGAHPRWTRRPSAIAMNAQMVIRTPTGACMLFDPGMNRAPIPFGRGSRRGGFENCSRLFQVLRWQRAVERAGGESRPILLRAAQFKAGDDDLNGDGHSRRVGEKNLFTAFTGRRSEALGAGRTRPERPLGHRAEWATAILPGEFQSGYDAIRRANTNSRSADFLVDRASGSQNTSTSLSRSGVITERKQLFFNILSVSEDGHNDVQIVRASRRRHDVATA